MAEGNPLSWQDGLLPRQTRIAETSRRVAGHKRPENDDHPRIIEETRSYFRDFLRLNEETTDRARIFRSMMKLHGDRANPGSLWGGVTAARHTIGQSRLVLRAGPRQSNTVPMPVPLLSLSKCYPA